MHALRAKDHRGHRECRWLRRSLLHVIGPDEASYTTCTDISETDVEGKATIKVEQPQCSSSAPRTSRTRRLASLQKPSRGQCIWILYVSSCSSRFDHYITKLTSPSQCRRLHGQQRLLHTWCSNVLAQARARPDLDRDDGHRSDLLRRRATAALAGW